MASISKRPDGQWRARYRDPEGREHARHFDRKVTAQRWLDGVTASVVTGRYVDPNAGKVTFEQYAQQWAERQVWAPRTGTGHRKAVRSTTFRGVELRHIRASHVEQWVKLMRDGDPAVQEPRKLAPGTIGTRYNHVRAVFRAAVRDRLIPEDPSAHVALPRRRKREAAMSIPTTAQVGALLDAAEPGFRPYVAVCAFAGLRLGEAAGLQVGDVDFLRRELHVRRQVQLLTGEVQTRLPKYGSERTVSVPAELVELLSRHVGTLPDREPGRWLFERSAGHPVHQNTVNWRWIAIRKRAKATGVRLHDLRHFYASGLIAAGCDVVTVSRALGHGSSTTTLGTYAHLWPTAEDRTRNAAGDLMRSATGALADSVRTNSGS